MFKHEDQRVGVFIDTQNMYYSARNIFKRKVNFRHIVEDAVADRRLIRANAYVIRTESEEEQPFFEALQKAGIQTREKDLIEYQSGQKKADWDVGIAVDIVQTLDMLDVVVLVSGDGDFRPLGEHVKSRGRIFEVMAFGGSTSSLLLDVVNDFIDLSENTDRYLIGPKIGGKKTRTKKAETKKEDTEEEKGEEKEKAKEVKKKTTTKKKKAKAKKKPAKTTKTGKKEEETADISQDISGFFMEVDADDQEESRTRRLEF